MNQENPIISVCTYSHEQDGVWSALDDPGAQFFRRPRPQSEKVPDVRTNVEQIEGLRIIGWALDLQSGREAFEVVCNGRTIECNVARIERRDLADALSTGHAHCGFEIELPGYMWETVPSGGKCEIHVFVNGQRITSNAIHLTRHDIDKALQDAALLTDSAHREYRTLVALEHAAYAQATETLSTESLRLVREEAQRSRLEVFLAGPNTHATTDSLANVEIEVKNRSADVDTLLLWTALRRFNLELQADTGSGIETLRRVLDTVGLKEKLRKRFFLAVIPYFCRTGEFLELRPLLNFNNWAADLRKSNQISDASIAIPFLVAQERLTDAAGALWGIAKLEKPTAWLHTECIWYALEQACALHATGKVNDAQDENFFYAVLAVIEALPAGHWSRIQDLHLVRCMVRLLAHGIYCTDNLRRAIVRAAIKHYGLSPAFWMEIERAATGSHSMDVALETARIRHRSFAQLIVAWRHNDLAGLRQLLMVLEYFRERGNRDADTFKRELIACALPHINMAEGDEMLREAVRSLEAIDTAECLRIGAYPLSETNRLSTLFPQMPDVVRSLIPTRKSVLYKLQYRASECLEVLRQAVAAKRSDDVQDLLVALLEEIQLLCRARAKFLGFELLASAYALACEAIPGAEALQKLLNRMRDILSTALESIESGTHAPAPVICGLGKLTALHRRHSDPFLGAFLAHANQATSRLVSELTPSTLSLPPRESLHISNRNVVADTLVVIYSCRKYLQTRVAAIRDSWVRDLQANGIPYVVLVGDGDDRLEDDVLALNVSDRYEDLPQKTLKLLEWVHCHTDFQYILKIDDDCYLDVHHYFASLSFKQHHYYGRINTKSASTMDRLWHQSKSSTARGTKSIDKSPAPSKYASGGAYSLSRAAIAQLLRQRRTSVGARLESASFMEDKLVGDLLAPCGIAPSDEDYDWLMRLRLFPDALPVAAWNNTFYPSAFSPIKVAHLDNEKEMHSTWANARAPMLKPHKIWPTDYRPQLGFAQGAASNQLELLSAPHQLHEVISHEIIVVSVVRNEMLMLPHFLQHYRKLGIEAFVFVDNLSDDGTREYLLQQEDAIVYSADTKYKLSHFGVAWQRTVLGNHCVGKWVLLVDADELLAYPGYEAKPLVEVVRRAAADGSDALLSLMIDMYPWGDLQEADLSRAEPFAIAGHCDSEPVIEWRLGSGAYSNSRSYVSRMRHRLFPDASPDQFMSQKVCLFRYLPWLQIWDGLHYACNLKVSELSTYLAHFRYHAGFPAKVVAEIVRKEHLNDAGEYRDYLTLLAKGRTTFRDEHRTTHLGHLLGPDAALQDLGNV